MSDVNAAKNIAEHLDKKYPGHLWAVSVSQGSIVIKNFALSERYGVHIKDTDLDNDYRIVIKLCGEFLERYGLKRDKLNQAQVIDQYATILRDRFDRPIGDTYVHQQQVKRLAL